tara:strand:- start:66 stop:332 length:267 start_codon:yes stop_codon:yes gene_type:complete
MRIIQTSYPRVKKIYTYDITQKELDDLGFSWLELQDALLDDDHERHQEAYNAWSEFYTDSDEECLDECGDGDFYDIYYDFEDDDEEDE